jgi:glutathione S-transferase
MDGKKVSSPSLTLTLTPDWYSYKPTLQAENPLINLPYVIDGKKVIAQTNACFLYLGRKFSMLGKDEDELALCEQLLCEV